MLLFVCIYIGGNGNVEVDKQGRKSTSNKKVHESKSKPKKRTGNLNNRP